MTGKVFFFYFHRIAGLIVGLQIVLWSAGGIIFSFIPLDTVHGDTFTASHEPEGIDFESVTVTMAEVMAKMNKQKWGEIGRVQFSQNPVLGPIYEIYDTGGAPRHWVDARTGEVSQQITLEQAEAFAQRDFSGSEAVLAAEFIENDPPGEYRGGPLPVYRVSFDNGRKTRLYISSFNGRVLARRNHFWRVFDFFWMLHTMDYRGRDDFNHWLLKISSLIAFLTAGSGLSLWGVRAFQRKL